MGMASNLIDGRLVGRALSKDSVAFEELVKRHMPAVSAVAIAYTKNHSDAEDVVQEAFLKAWQSLDSLQSPRRFGGWVVAIARNAARNFHNKKRRESEKHDRYQAEAESVSEIDEPDVSDPAKDLLPGLISALQESDRELVLLHYQSGMKTREIARLMDLSHDVVRKRLQRIRLKLGAALLASLESDDQASLSEEKRASRIASAVVAFTPGWKGAATGASWKGLFGVSLGGKELGIGFVVLAILVAGTFITRTQTGDVESANGQNSSIAQSSGVNDESGNVEPANRAAEPPDPIDPAVATVAAVQPVVSRISGRIYEADTGKGIENAKIILRPGGVSPWLDVRSNENGEYEFDGLESGTHWIRVNGDEAFFQRYPDAKKLTKTRYLELEEGASMTKVDFQVIHGLVVSGVLLGPDNEPIANAWVKGWTKSDEVDAVATTDAEGKFELFGMRSDIPTRFWALADGFALVPHGPIKIPAEGIRDLELKMDPESTIRGHLADQDGNPLSDIKIIPWPEDIFELPNGYSQKTDHDGRFLLSRLHASTYRELMLGFPDEGQFRHMEDARNIVVGRNEHVKDMELVYEFPGNLTITGRVLNDIGAPIKGARLQATRGNIRRTTRTDENGRYVFKELGEGMYELSSLFGGGPKVMAEAGTEVPDVVVGRRGAVSGTVVDAVTKEPLPVFEILTDPFPRRWKEFRNAAGRFSLSDLPAEMRSIVARAPGYAEGYLRNVLVTPGQTLENAVVELAKSGSISGTVYDPEGKPLRDAMVGYSKYYANDNPRTNAEGRFLFENAKSGPSVFGVWHPRYAPKKIDVVVEPGDAMEVEIHLVEGARVTGRIGQPDNRPESIIIELISRDEGEQERHQNIDAGSDGTYEITGIAPGNYTLHYAFTIGLQGRVLDMPISFSGTEHEIVDFEVVETETSARFDVDLPATTGEFDSRVYVEVSYEKIGASVGKNYSYASNQDELILQGLLPGTGTLTARLYNTSFSGILAVVEPHEVEIQSGTENRFVLDFADVQQ